MSQPELENSFAGTGTLGAWSLISMLRTAPLLRSLIFVGGEPVAAPRPTGVRRVLFDLLAGDGEAFRPRFWAGEDEPLRARFCAGEDEPLRVRPLDGGEAQRGRLCPRMTCRK
jgi:hypothetical protein